MLGCVRGGRGRRQWRGVLAVVVRAGREAIPEGWQMSKAEYYGQREFDEDEVRLCTANDLVFSILKRQAKRKDLNKMSDEGEFAWYENAFPVPPFIDL